MKKITYTILFIFTVFILINALINLKSKMSFLAKSKKYTVAIIYDQEIGPKSGCKYKYLFYVNNREFRSYFNDTEPCGKRINKSQKYRIEYIESDPSHNQINLKFKFEKEMILDTIYKNMK